MTQELKAHILHSLGERGSDDEASSSLSIRSSRAKSVPSSWRSSRRLSSSAAAWSRPRDVAIASACSRHAARSRATSPRRFSIATSGSWTAWLTCTAGVM